MRPEMRLLRRGKEGSSRNVAVRGGGRFYQDSNRYRIVDIGDACDVDRMACWLTLGDIRRLLDEPGWLTNEARSALSLLLPWL